MHKTIRKEFILGTYQFLVFGRFSLVLQAELKATENGEGEVLEGGGVEVSLYALKGINNFRHT